MIEVHWDDPDQTIIRMEFTPPWTAEEFATANWQMFELAEGRNSRLDLINVIHPDQGPPPEDMISLVHQALRQLPRQFVMIVTVGDVRAAKTADSLDRIVIFTEAPFKLRAVETKAAAHALIAQDRAADGNLPVGEDVDSESEGTSF